MASGRAPGRHDTPVLRVRRAGRTRGGLAEGWPAEDGGPSEPVPSPLGPEARRLSSFWPVRMAPAVWGSPQRAVARAFLKARGGPAGQVEKGAGWKEGTGRTSSGGGGWGVLLAAAGHSWSPENRQKKLGWHFSAKAGALENAPKFFLASQAGSNIIQEGPTGWGSAAWLAGKQVLPAEPRVRSPLDCSL